ncbi:Gfo/Idh/MocA family protein [Portibacter lacus]|uniref:Oxidoreductase n=1 Tax=Portibacter lacus TaxID=1099794 RepID=A0AA37WD70_9BACT|nr:Gfo/Idh/MocA family oxidoreductase [Portibacter lacus]GLR16513.1 oxidoreductase [Portibacter lacus]
MEFEQQLKSPITPLPIAIIGAGGIIRDAHLPAYQKAHYEILGVYDIDKAKIDQLKHDFPGIRTTFNTLAELIKHVGNQRIIYDVAVPANHLYSILEQLPIGSIVLMQKPMGESLDEAIRIQELCIKKKFVSAVNFQLKYAPYMLAARDIISQGLIGEVFDVEIKVCTHTPWELWDFLKEKPRVEVLYHSIHYVDLVRSLLGNPTKVYASSIRHPRTSDLAATRSSIILDYDEFTQARILTNHGHDYGTKHQESYLKIEGSKGAIKVLIGLSLNYPKGLPPKMEFYTAESKEWKEIPLIGGWFPDAFIGSMTNLQNHTLDKSIPLRNSSEDALQTMELVEKIYESSEKGGIIFKSKKI